MHEKVALHPYKPPPFPITPPNQPLSIKVLSTPCETNKKKMSHHHKFSWENHPEISELTPQSSENPKHAPKLKLRPPPCPSDSPGFSKPGIYVPLPPCAFQPPPKRPQVLRRDDDPFFAAYMKCTKGGKSEKMRGGDGGGSWKEGFGISCKKSCGVRDDAMVRVSHVPVYHGRKSSYTERELRQWEDAPRPSSFIL